MQKTRWAILFVAVVAVQLAAQSGHARSEGHWVSAWSTAVHTPLPFPGLPPSPVFENQTVRMVVRPTIGGQRLRIRLSNEFGTTALKIGAAHVALSAKGSAIVPDSDRALTFDGRASVIIPPGAPILFLEVDISDASEFTDTLCVRGSEVGGYRILCVDSPVVPNAIAAIMLDLRDRLDKLPHAYFSWSEGNPIVFLLRYVALGEGDTAPVTHEVLRRAEPNPDRRPAIHVGGER